MGREIEMGRERGRGINTAERARERHGKQGKEKHIFNITIHRNTAHMRKAASSCYIIIV